LLRAFGKKPFALRLSKGRTVRPASGSGSAPASGRVGPMARREGLLPRRESLWLGEDRLCRTMNGLMTQLTQSPRGREYCMKIFYKIDACCIRI
jgi:hypothetical protein